MSVTSAVFEGLVSYTSCASAPNATVVDCLVQLSMDDLITAADSFASGALRAGLPWTPTVDGVELTAFPYQLAQQGRVAKVPILIGTVRDEGASFIPVTHQLDEAGFDEFFSSMFQFNATQVQDLKNLYPVTQYNNTPCCTAWFWAASRAFGDYLMTCPAHEAAGWLFGQQTVFGFEFMHAPFYNASNPNSNEFAYHSSDVPYVFHVDPLLDPAEGGLTVANTTANFWINFATSADPNHGPMPVPLSWPQYSNATDSWVLLDVSSTVAPGWRQAQCEFWAPYRFPA